MRLTLLNRDRVVGAGAAIAVRVVAGGIIEFLGGGGAGGVSDEPVVGYPHSLPVERMAIIVEDAGFDRVVWGGPYFGRLFCHLRV